jgi:DNA-directed RNA polymerase specialized sigma24 family protein
MLKKSEINQEDFANLLGWLDEDREAAAVKYEEIRHRLIQIFTIQKLFDAENLADQVFDRVCRKLPEIAATYHGKKDLYFYGVAKNIHLEAHGQPQTIEFETERMAANTKADEQTELYFKCLENCLQKLSADERELVVGYYENEKTAKIDYRKKIAEKLGINLNFLRIKVFRLRNELKNCIVTCVKNA